MLTLPVCVSLTTLHDRWASMRNRCTYPSQPKYKDYGGRGIRVCPAWQDDFTAFRDWALAHGYRDYLTLDRIDNDGDYTPENCRWTTMHTQARNRRNNRLVTAFGETKCVEDWIADGRCQVTTGSGLRHRLNAGMDDEAAISTPHRRTSRVEFLPGLISTR